MYEDFHPFEPLTPPARTPWWVLAGVSLEVALGATASATSALRAAQRYGEDPRPLGVRPASAVRVADLATAATLMAADPDRTGLEPDFAPWTDAAVWSRTRGLSTVHLTKTGA